MPSTQLQSKQTTQGANGSRRNEVHVEYIPVNERRLIIRITRPGQPPVDVYADVYPRNTGTG
jgi:hypothetical protein